MNAAPAMDSPEGAAERDYQRDLREMNAALLVSSVRQQELAEQAQKAEAAATHLAQIVAYSDDAIISKDLNGIIMSWNNGAQRLFGYVAEEVIGKPVTILIPADRVNEEPEILARIRRGEVVDHYETVRRRKDGSLVDISLTVSPIKNAAGRVIGASKVARDITKQKGSERALRDSEERLAAELAATQRLHEVGHQMIHEGNLETVYQQMVVAAVDIIRSDMASLQIVDESQDALLMLAWHGFDPAFGKILAVDRPGTKTPYSVARRVGRRVIVPDVETCDFIAGTPALQDHRQMGIRAVQATPLMSRGGKLLGMISTHWRQPHSPSERDLRLMDMLARQAADVIERKHFEERQKLLLGELAHRVKNTLATVQAIATETRNSAESPDHFYRAFEGRLRALADANGLLVKGGWQPTSLHALFAKLCETLMRDAGRYKLAGEDVALSPAQALALSMMLYEVMTNSLKYGAWSNEKGTVATETRVLKDPGRERARIEWVESGGPPVRAPTRSGYGTHMLQGLAAFELEGRTDIEYAPSGVRCTIEFPLSVAP